jgi:alpha/beta superfamily hydrolase
MTSTCAPAQPDQRPEIHTLRSVFLPGPAGRLEAVLNEGAPNSPFAALVSHPHPLGGGTLHNKVVYHAMKVLNDPQWGFAFPVLRFNFRGTGLSEGTHDGIAEKADVLAALDWLQNEYKRPILAVGFSFGAAMTVAACCGRNQPSASIRALIALGLPTHAQDRDYHYSSLKTCTLPKLFLSGDQDQFAPAQQLAQVVASAANPKQLVLLPGADHFFTGHLDAMQSSLSSWLKEQLS